MYMNALQVETCMLYMYFKETSLISHASLESSNKESINQYLICQNLKVCQKYKNLTVSKTHRSHQGTYSKVQNIFLELSAGQIRQNCRATLVIPPGISVATVVTICCNHRGGKYFLHRKTRKLGSTATSTVITRLLSLTNYVSGAENETHQALLGYTNRNIEMQLQPSCVSPRCSDLIRFWS